MRRTITIAALITLTAIGIAAQSVDNAVKAIRERYNDISEKAYLCETDDEHGSIGELVMTELKVNARNHQWRAVGIFNETYRFFYKGGDTEKHLYPDQLVFVRVSRKVSAREYEEQYLYDDAGRLIFYFYKAVADGEVPSERRVYFRAGRPIRFIDGGLTRDRLENRDTPTMTEIITASGKIKEVFTRSIKL